MSAEGESQAYTKPERAPGKETHYDLLGVDPDSTQDQIQRAYFSLLAKLQPTLDQDPEARARMPRIRVAYRVLSDTASRELYNQEQGLDEPPKRRWDLPGDDPTPTSWYMGYIAMAGMVFGPVGAIGVAVLALLRRRQNKQP